MRIKGFLMGLVIYSNVALSQISGVYSTKTENADIDCCLYLYKNGVYEVILEEQETDDIVLNILVSYGVYALKDKQLHLSDKFNGFKMLFELQNEVLIARKSFNWLANKRFTKSTFQIWDNPSFLKSKIKPLNKNQLGLKQKYDNKTFFGIGMYENEQGFHISLQANNKYKFDYKQIVLSEGSWSQNGNVLILYDAYLENSFYILIGKDGLLSRFFPGEYKGCLLTKKK